MNTSDHSLQILHHEEVFSTREAALSYITDYYKPFSLDAEPLMVKYGDTRNPNVILAFGTSNAPAGSFYAIDMTKANEKIDEIAGAIETDKEELEYISEILNGVVTATGLTVDDNKIENKVSYDVDTRDEVIGTALSIAEAVDLLSKYTQKTFTENKLSVDDTDSIRLIYEVNENGGKILKAEIKVSTNGDTDELDFNNNIVGIKNDGIYAASHLAYDELRHELIFTTSGYKNGRFQDDAIVERVNLGEHTKLVVDNENHSVKLAITDSADGNTKTISADVKISSVDDNILELKDDKLAVIGRANNIKYAGTTVASELNKHKDTLSALTADVEDVINTVSDLETEVEKKIESVEVEKNNDLQYFINVDGVKVGEINIPADQFFKGASYDPQTKVLTLTFIITREGVTSEEVVNINISDLVDVYTAGDGLNLSENKFSIRRNQESENYLVLNTDGIGIFGINAALETKENKGTSYSKEESDSKFLTNQSLIPITERISNNENSISVINGNEAQEGSIKNAIKVSKDYTDEKVSVKANSSDVYTKIEIDNKGFLTEHQDISHLATKDSLRETDNNVAQNTSDIEELNTTVNDIKFITSESDTVNVTMDKQTGEEYRTLEANVKIKTIPGTENTNIIKKDSNGLFATVSLNYDKLTNRITFNDGNGDKTFELNNFGILQDAFYDSENKSIVLIVKKDDETTERITIPVDDLVNTWTVENKENSPVFLEKTTSEEGDILSANLSILNHNHNLLTNDNGSLFVDGDSNKHFALWGDEETTVQAVINKLKSDNETININLANYQADLETQKGKISQNETDIVSIKERLATLETNFANLKERVDAFDARINEVEDETQATTNLVNTLNTQLGDISGPETVAERLAKIEDVIAKLIDFGEYNIGN